MTSPKYSPLWHLFLSRVREFYREPEAVFWVYVFPILMVVTLGTAFRNQPIKEVGLDIEAGPYSERVLESIKASPGLVCKVVSASEARQRLRVGQADLLLRVSSGGETVPNEAPPKDEAPPDFSTLKYEFVFDETRPESLAAKSTVDDTLQRMAGRVDKLQPIVVPFDEPAGRYLDFLVPGLIGMSLMGGGLWGVGFVTVDMRIRKLLKRFLATPMRRGDFLMGVICSRLIFMVPEILAITLFSGLIYGIRIQGRYVDVLILVILGSLTFAGIGLLVASRAKTLETVSGLINLVTLPMWLLSGIFFSSSRFPEWMLPVIKLLPLTALIDLLRGVMQEGTPLEAMWPRLLVVVIWGAGSFSIALWCFRWNES